MAPDFRVSCLASVQEDSKRIWKILQCTQLLLGVVSMIVRPIFRLSTGIVILNDLLLLPTKENDLIVTAAGLLRYQVLQDSSWYVGRKETCS